jgi:dipeptidyl-peptidase-4
VTQLELGKYEVEDQIDAAKVIGNYAFVDKTRIGIFGWSYGGFMASNSLFKGNDT